MIGDNPTHANFSVNDMAAAKSFYRDKLGFRIKKDHEYIMELESGAGTKVHIYHKDDHVPWDSTIFGIEVSNVEQAIDELASNGVQVEKLPGTNDKGIMSDPEMGDVAWFKDPAGNWLCISNPA